MKIPILHSDIQVSLLPVYDTLQVDRELMGAKEIRAEIDLPGTLNSPIGSYINHRGSRYTINTIPSPTKLSNYRYKYNLTFESDTYRLYDKKLKHLGNRTFQYYGSPADFAQLIVDNINEIDSGWTVGICDDLPEKTIDFSGHTCRTAMDTVAETFEIEWDEVGKSLTFVKQVGNTTSLIFEYGRGKGLYSLSYQYNSEKNIVTRAFGYGSTRNLPEGYRGGATQLMFEGGSLDANVSIYGPKEGDYENEDIYPEISGLVSAAPAWVEGDGTFKITDATLAFNLNDYFSADTPKLSFKSGELQGQEFEILKYDNGTKVITLKVFTDSQGNTLPSAVFQAAIGDTYTLFDMHLPDEIVQDAEDRLQAATQIWLNENCVPRVLYSLEMDPLYARDNGIYLNPGDKVRVIDEALGIDEMIRVTKTSYPFIFPSITVNTKITCEIANFIPYTTTERVIADTIDNKQEIKVVNRTNAEKARLNSLNLRTLQGRIFNPDGTLFDGPESLQAGMAIFGYDSQNMNLNNVVFSANLLADPNSFKISAGQLIHYIYKINGLGYIWELPINSWAGLDPAKFYYVYAKCNKAALVGTWEISETGVAVNDIPGYYAFNLGILYEVNSDGYRDFVPTKGITTIVGDRITSGLIQDITGQNYINLTNGKFNMGDASNGIDWDVTTPGTLTIRGAVASEVIQVGSDGVINARISGITDPINPSESIRFAAGASDEFKVLDDGSMVATAGRIGNWNITAGGIINEDGSAYIIARDTNSDGTAQAMIGTNVFPATAGVVGVAYFENSKDNPFGTNYGAVFIAEGGLVNIAAEYTGYVKVNTGFIVSGNRIPIGGTFEYERNGHVYEFEFVNGLLVTQQLIEE